MSTRETDNTEGHPENSVGGGVLAALPRTRPQRASPRRAAARQRAGNGKSETADAASSPSVDKKPASPKPAPKKTSTQSKASRRATRKGKPAEPPAPKQGYEPEEDVELGKTVNPPTGLELVESVADIFGELANSSLSAGGRILKDAFSLLRRP